MNLGTGTIIRQGFGLSAALMLAGVVLAEPPPACWDEPRMLYLGTPPADLANRVHFVRRAGRAETELVTRNPDTNHPGPWRAAVEVALVDGDTLIVMLENISGKIAPREIGKSLLYLRVPWGRTTFSDLLIDRRDGELIYHEQVIDGTAAWRQARESCALPEMAEQPACDCASPIKTWPRPRAVPQPDSIHGLLLLPGLFGPSEAGGVVAADPARPLPLYLAPDGSREVMLVIDDFHALEWREYAYEAAAAVVTGVQGRWYRIRLADGRQGWVAPGDADRFLSLEELFSNNMTYLVRDGPGRLWRNGRGGWVAFDLGPRGETAVEVVSVDADGDSLWLEVVIPEHAPCGGRQRAARGWIPAWDDAGRLNVWFHSRGC